MLSLDVLRANGTACRLPRWLAAPPPHPGHSLRPPVATVTAAGSLQDFPGDGADGIGRFLPDRTGRRAALPETVDLAGNPARAGRAARMRARARVLQAVHAGAP